MPNEKIEFIITADDSQYASVMAKIESNTNQTSSALTSAFNLSLGAVAFDLFKEKAMDAFNVFTEFDLSTAQITAFNDVSGNAMQSLKDKAYQLGEAFGVMPRQIMAGMSQMLQDGKSVEETLASIESVTKLSIGTGLNFVQSSKEISATLDAWRLSAGQADDVIDKMVKTVASGSMTAEDYFKTLEKSRPVVASYGVSLSELNAIIAASAKMNIEGELATTGITNAYRALLKPVGDGKQVLDALGFSAYDSSGKVRSFADMVDELGGKLQSPTDRIAVFGQEAGPLMSALLQQGGDAIRNYEEQLNNSSGAADKAAQVMSSGLNAEVNKLKATFEGGLLKVMYEFEPAATAFVGMMNNCFQATSVFLGGLRTGSAGIQGLIGVMAEVGRGAEFITDAVGLTSDSTTYFKDVANDAFGSAKESLEGASVAYSGISDSAAAASASSSASSANVSESIREIAAATGVAMETYADFVKAEQDGLVEYDETIGSYVNGETGKRIAIEKTSEAVEDQAGKVEGASSSISAAIAAQTSYYEENARITGQLSDDYLAKKEANIRKEVEAAKRAGVEIVDVEAAVNTRMLDLRVKASSDHLRIIEETSKGSLAGMNQYLPALEEHLALVVEAQVAAGADRVAAEEAANAKLNDIRIRSSQDNLKVLETISKESQDGQDDYYAALQAHYALVVEAQVQAGVDRVAAERAANIEIEKAYDDHSKAYLKQVEDAVRASQEKLKVTKTASEGADGGFEEYMAALRDHLALVVEAQVQSGVDRATAERAANVEIENAQAEHAESYAKMIRDKIKLMDELQGSQSFNINEMMALQEEAIRAEIEAYKAKGGEIVNEEAVVSERLMGIRSEYENSASSSLENVREKAYEAGSELSRLDGQTAVAVIDADSSAFDSKLASVKSALDGFTGGGTGGYATDTTSIEEMRKQIKYLDETPTMDPFGKSREEYYRKINEILERQSGLQINEYSSVNQAGERAAREQEKISNDLAREQERAAAESAREQGRIANDLAREQERAVAESAREQERITRELAKAQEDAAKEAFRREKEAKQEAVSAMIESAKNELDAIRDQQKQITEIYRDEAKKRYDSEVEARESRISLLKDELSDARTQFDILKQIYSESGAGGVEYYTAAADALSRRAQEMQDSGTVGNDLIEKWLSDELLDLQRKAADEGVGGIGDYVAQLKKTQEESGKFSKETAVANSEIKELQIQLEAIKNGGFEKYIDTAAISVYNFDSRISDLDSSIARFQARQKEINGMEYESAAMSVDSYSLSVSRATDAVRSLVDVQSSAFAGMAGAGFRQPSIDESTSTRKPAGGGQENAFGQAIDRGGNTYVTIQKMDVRTEDERLTERVVKETRKKARLG